MNQNGSFFNGFLTRVRSFSAIIEAAGNGRGGTVFAAVVFRFGDCLDRGGNLARRASGGAGEGGANLHGVYRSWCVYWRMDILPNAAAYTAICFVVVSRHRHRYGSFLRLAYDGYMRRRFFGKQPCASTLSDLLFRQSVRRWRTGISPAG